MVHNVTQRHLKFMRLSLCVCRYWPPPIPHSLEAKGNAAGYHRLFPPWTTWSSCIYVPPWQQDSQFYLHHKLIKLFEKRKMWEKEEELKEISVVWRQEKAKSVQGYDQSDGMCKRLLETSPEFLQLTDVSIGQSECFRATGVKVVLIFIPPHFHHSHIVLYTHNHYSLVRNVLVTNCKNTSYVKCFIERWMNWLTEVISFLYLWC